MSLLIPPHNFGIVEVDLYRSAHPNALNFPFLEKLRLRKIIHIEVDLAPEFVRWVEEQQIELVNLADVGRLNPWKPMTEEVVVEGLRLLLEPRNYPLLVMCNLGRHRTGTMIGCLRKLQRWHLTCILEEYRRHARSKFRLVNEQFIELFDIDLVHIPEKCPPWFHAATQPALGATATGQQSTTESVAR
uniref:protein-tyrosine-phosphatase n=1 Tax=Coccolithus braarudii TaxID=221442 RepID=A0A7S0LHR3_9EUKA|mmetsp:Transcript_41130/g.87790  ORF Transcript_41130/g.87790 Transcript_41130/m.87790 type:complete len:188 (+) Transcript_41130:89-652(+)|eukprot:CAMPEP_0183356114 /NCGR_PEP_ID=MMETSP0164_2-20130417/43147_1 /TAXON_ID=221442 /ORGANISM="Coccolithus pelagicus ssp braarudi, Strain PLY182g" /LENGTH=187 /DNA_ID=CAMNT_0025529423 /DNA_START=88 /DNA_END=651 /DNA_ORIENTATION=+